MKVSTSAVAAVFAILRPENRYAAIVDMVLLVFQHFHIYRRVGWSQNFPLKIFFLVVWVVQERKISPKSEFWGRISGGRPGAKTFEILEKQAFRCGRP